MRLSVNITKKFPGFTLEVSFETEKEPLGMLGASGSGKSMTLRCIAGLVTPDSGTVILNDRVLFDAEKKINIPAQKRNIGYLFQNYALFPNMTVAQNIAFGLQGYTGTQKSEIIAEKIALLQLAGLEGRYPFQLSGGEQQRTALARALVLEPEVLLLDEPFAALDNHLRSEMEKMLLDTLFGYQGVTLFVTHNLEECFRVSKNLIVMDRGTIAAGGPKEEIFRNPPTLSVARLTGCKNISHGRAIAPGKIKALAWGCDLSVSQTIPANFSHVGIRAHQLTINDKAGLVNSVPCWLAQMSETPYKVFLYVSLHKPPENAHDYALQVEVYKEEYQRIKSYPFPWFVQLAPEQLFLTSER